MRLWDNSNIFKEVQALKQPLTDEAKFLEASTLNSEDGRDEPSSSSSFLNKLYETSKLSIASSCPKASAGNDLNLFRETFKAINV